MAISEYPASTSTRLGVWTICSTMGKASENHKGTDFKPIFPRDSLSPQQLSNSNDAEKGFLKLLAYQIYLARKVLHYLFWYISCTESTGLSKIIKPLQPSFAQPENSFLTPFHVTNLKIKAKITMVINTDREIQFLPYQIYLSSKTQLSDKMSEFCCTLWNLPLQRRASASWRISTQGPGGQSQGRRLGQPCHSKATLHISTAK